MNVFAELFRPLGYVPRSTYENCPLIHLDEPEFVVIPLEYPGQVLYKPTVKVGDKVRKNQIIAKSRLDNCVNASISGTIKEIKPIWTARGFNVQAVIIEKNNEPPYSRDELFKQFGVPFESASRIERMKASGIISPWNLPGRFHHEEDVDTFPDVKHIVVKGVNEEPTVFTFEILLRENLEKLLRGINQLSNIAPKAKIWLTVPIQMTDWAKKEFGKKVEVVGLPDDYKTRIERLVVPKITGISIPNTVPYRKKGVAVISDEYLLNLVSALDGESPFTSKYLTINGHDMTGPLMVKVPIGTPIRFVLKNNKVNLNSYHRLLVGGPMKGYAQFTDEVPLTKSSHGLFLMPDFNIPADEDLNCVNCGRCTRVCPVNLQVHLINRYIEYNLLKEVQEYHPEACTECGLCAYVCPNRRPLVQLIRMCNQYNGSENEQFAI